MSCPTSSFSPASPSSSFAPTITKGDAERFLQASQWLEHRTAATREQQQPLSARWAAAVRDNRGDEFLASFVSRTSHLAPKQADAACLIFSRSLSLRSKLQELYQAVEGDWSQLFLVLLTAISACTHGDQMVIVEGRPDPSHHPSERPAKRAKLVEADGLRTCQSPSFDSSLATLKDEDDVGPLLPRPHHELKEAADQAAHEMQTSPDWKGSGVDACLAWCESGGGKQVSPWLSLLDVEAWKKHSDSNSPASLTTERDDDDDEDSSPLLATSSSPALISFDFSSDEAPSSLLIDITEENLQTLREFVSTTHMWHTPASELCKLLLSAGTRRRDDRNGGNPLRLSRASFLQALERLFPTQPELVQRVLQDLFSLYELSDENDWADLKDVAIGMCFFCDGSKSVKLATAFEMIDERRRGYLTEPELFGYLRSYLLALVALSLLVQTNQKPMSRQRRSGIRAAVDSGARWTLSHYTGSSPTTTSHLEGRYSFESFATWYSHGGYNIAPWLELLDLSKTLALIQDTVPVVKPAVAATTTAAHTRTPLVAVSKNAPHANAASTTTTTPSSRPRDRMSSLRRHHSARNSGVPPEILFSFPLAANRYLVVLKEDAAYVRDVVETLGLLTSTPDDLWSALSKVVARRHKPVKDEPAIYVSSETFLQCMNDVCRSSSGAGRKRSSPGAPATRDELLVNFFHCFDVTQCDRVPLDELMGGLALLCGGKKSAKLSFAFTIFDTRPEMRKRKKDPGVVNSLSGEDLFLFLRSILIVTFSCCRQSLDMTDEVVSQCIADTANMICNDVMRHQWETKQTDRCNFDEFGQWYNDGGFERAPWLELLDLSKWVLLGSFHNLMGGSGKHSPGAVTTAKIQPQVLSLPPPELPEADVPPPPPEDELDASFFEDNGLMPMDSMDEMDMMLMPQPSTDRDIDGDGIKTAKNFSFSPRSRPQEVFSAPDTPSSYGNPLSFLVITGDDHGGYSVCCSRRRIDRFRRILEASGLHNATVEDACNAVLAKASRPSKSDTEPKLTKDGFQSALRLVSTWRPKTNSENQREMSRLFDSIFSAFNRDGASRPSVMEVACGLTVLCQGKKSDKLEFAFEVLDKNKRGLLSKQDMKKYLQSFMTVLLTVALCPALAPDPSSDTLTTLDGSPCDPSFATIQKVVAAGAEWAADQAFRDFDQGRKRNNGSMTFDDFADWYTSKGFESIPWLELIDLRKWSLSS